MPDSGYTSVAHVLALGTLTGMTIHTSFVNGIIQYKHLPRKVFGGLQSKQFPPYFVLQTALSAGLVFTSSQLGKIALSPSWLDQYHVPIWTASCVAALTNLVWVGPASTRNMFARHKLDNAGQTVPSHMTAAFARLHGVSTLLNLVTVFATVYGSAWVASKLR